MPWSSGVDEGFSPSKASTVRRSVLAEGADASLPIVVHVGRLGPEKNSDEIPTIFHETWKVMQGKVRFVIIGDGLLRNQVEKQLADLGVPCHFSGYLRGEALKSSFASCDVFFSPSTTEGFPLVFLEAMRSGLSVVGPVAGGVPDAYTKGIEGALYDPHDAKSAASAIQRAIEGGKEMRSRAEMKGKTFSWTRVCGEMEELLRIVVEKRQHSGWKAWWTSLFAAAGKEKKY
jgi:glycosyltransferase involved in cell wall biosynthesis